MNVLSRDALSAPPGSPHEILVCTFEVKRQESKIVGPPGRKVLRQVLGDHFAARLTILFFYVVEKNGRTVPWKFSHATMQSVHHTHRAEHHVVACVCQAEGTWKEQASTRGTKLVADTEESDRQAGNTQDVRRRKMRKGNVTGRHPGVDGRRCGDVEAQASRLVAHDFQVGIG